MAIPDPQPGLVVSYAYLWHHEHLAGHDEGVKDRPSVIVLANHRADDNATVVTVLPITHRAPSDPSWAIEIPPAVKRYLGLDEARSWIVVADVPARAPHGGSSRDWRVRQMAAPRRRDAVVVREGFAGAGLDVEAGRRSFVCG